MRKVENQRFKEMLIHGKHIDYTRQVPPDFTSRPYWCLDVECPECGLEFSIIEKSVEPGQILTCGNAECLKQIQVNFEPDDDDYECNAGVPIFKVQAGTY